MQVAPPLHELTLGENAGKEKAAIQWDDRCQQAFNDLRRLCTTPPILAYADGWPAWPTTISNCTTKPEKPISMQKLYQGCPGQGAYLTTEVLTSRSQLEQCELCKKLPLKASQAPLKHTFVICTSWTQCRTVSRSLV